MQEMYILHFHPLLFVLCFPNTRACCVKEKSYFIQLLFRDITYVAVLDTPHKVPDEPM